ncbi:MAG: prolipoprotein diacylglyceryl transferase [Bacillota bacterium]
MEPVAFEIGPFFIRWYGLLISTALGLGTFLAYREARRQGINPDHILNLVLLVAPLGIVGARLYYVLFSWGYYSSNPGEVFAVWHGGLAIHGAILAGGLGVYIYVRRQGLNFWELADIMAPSVILGQAIGRWGNYFNGEAYGSPTTLPWAIYVDGAYRHPAFFYEFIWDMLIFAFLFWLRRRISTLKGDVFLIYLMLYSLGRFFIEQLRTDSLMLGPLRVAQVVSIITIIISVVLYRRHRNSPKTTG